MVIVTMILLSRARAARSDGRPLPSMVLMTMIVALGMMAITTVGRLAPAAGTRAGPGVFVGGGGLLLGHQVLLSSEIEVAYTFPRW